MCRDHLTVVRHRELVPDGLQALAARGAPAGLVGDHALERDRHHLLVGRDVAGGVDAADALAVALEVEVREGRAVLLEPLDKLLHAALLVVLHRLHASHDYGVVELLAVRSHARRGARGGVAGGRGRRLNASVHRLLAPQRSEVFDVLHGGPNVAPAAASLISSAASCRSTSMRASLLVGVGAGGGGGYASPGGTLWSTLPHVQLPPHPEKGELSPFSPFLSRKMYCLALCDHFTYLVPSPIRFLSC